MHINETMTTQEHQIKELVVKLRDQGMRITPQRMAVLKTLIGSHEHLSAEDIYDRVRAEHPMIGLATVYKTVSMLKEVGAVTELHFNNDCARYDGSGGGPHPHFVCTRCNTIIDIDDRILDNLPGSIAEKTGYTITNYRLDFFGLCQDCQQR